MSYQNFNPKLYQDNPDQIQFQVISRSHQYKPKQDPLTRSLQQEHKQGGLGEVISGEEVAALENNAFDDSDIFNDVIEGGGVDPSIDESIRDSIKCSFVSSEYAEEADDKRGQGKQGNKMNEEPSHLKDNYVMNRLNWISYLKVVFDQLESFNQNKQKHVNTGNFIVALRKIKDLLPMLSRNDYYKSCSDVAFTYMQVEQGVAKMPKYITWDNVIDIFLARSFSQMASQQATPFQQINQNEQYSQSPVPQQLDESQLSHVELRYQEEDDDDGEPQQQIIHANHRKDGSKQQSIQAMHGSTLSNPAYQQQQQPARPQRNNEFIMSFADSVVYQMTGTHELQQQQTSQTQEYQCTQQLLAQAPLLMDKDDDEACEIDSDDGDGDEESKSNNSRRKKSRVDESIRSSRTATFKSVRGGGGAASAAHTTMVNNTTANMSMGVGTPTTNHAHDSYYAQNTNGSKKTMPYSQQQQIMQVPLQAYYTHTSAQQQYMTVLKNEFLDQDDGQVEVGSNHSRTSSQRNRGLVNMSGTSNSSGAKALHQAINKEALQSYDDQAVMLMPGADKSTRISSLNSAIKNTCNHNSTILSQNSSQSSQHSYKKKGTNASKASMGSSQGVSASGTITSQQSIWTDWDLQGKNLKNLEMDFKPVNGKTLRSINLSINSLIKLPSNLIKSIQFMNISFNKLKSLNGIENCYNLLFLNVQGNQITTTSSIVRLQSLRELFFSQNQVSMVKDIAQLKSLQLLDLSYNKLSEHGQIIPLQGLTKLKTLSLQGNIIQQKMANYELDMKKLMPQLQVLDPDQIKDFSQYSATMENICFTDPPIELRAASEQQNSQLSLNMILLSNAQPSRKGDNLTEGREKERSKTPKGERDRSPLVGKSAHNKSHLISPNRKQTFDHLHHHNPYITTSSSKAQKYSQQQHQQQQQYDEQPIRFSTKSGTSNQTTGTTGKGNVTQRQPITREIQNLSAMKDKSPLRERSTSNNNVASRNQQLKAAQSQGMALPSSTLSSGAGAGTGGAPHLPMSSSKPKPSQIPQQQQQQQQQHHGVIKKVNVSMLPSTSMQGKITPKRSNIHTPRQQQEKPTHYYKRSFCKTEEEPSISQDTTSEKATVKTVPETHQNSSSKKQPLRQAANKKNEVLSPLMNKPNANPMYQQVINNAPQQQPLLSRNQQMPARPMTNLKQRPTAGGLNQHYSQRQGEDFISNSNHIMASFTGGTGTGNNSMIHPTQPPQSTKNMNNYSQSFVFDHKAGAGGGRNTPSHQQKLQGSRPQSSQLQKFINASRNTSRQGMQTPMLSSSNQQQQPSQKVTNLPPKNYQSRAEKPGDKKSKADMSSSRLMNASKIGSSGIMQTGGNRDYDDDSDGEDGDICEKSGGSTSPVGEEGSDIKKMVVDLTQFMNKQ